MQEPYNQPPIPPTSGYNQSPPPQDSKKIVAGICGILLGCFGVHKFILGYTTEGIIMLVAGLFSCGAISTVIGLVEGIIYLTKTDEEFYQTYVLNKRGWF
jgi:TM2 domain-containing membrane protein YozV